MSVTCTCIARTPAQVQTGVHWPACKASTLPLWLRRTIQNPTENRRVASKEIVR